jgi:hypothetical protein
LSRDKYACGVGVVLDGADGSPAEQLSAENPAASTGEQGKLAQWSISALEISHDIL